MIEQKTINISDIDTKYIEFDSFRKPRTGGQHCGNISSGIRAKHIPSGIAVYVDVNRSQIENRNIALMILMSIINQDALYEDDFGHLIKITRETKEI